MTARTDLDTYISGKLAVTGAGPASRVDIVAALTAVENYVDYGTYDATDNSVTLGAVASVSGLSCTIERGRAGLFKLVFTFTSVAVTHADSGASGGFGSLKIFDFVQGAVLVLGSRSNLVFTGDALIDTDAGDMAFIYGFGSVACNAGDAALTGTEVDYSAVSSTITLSSHTATSATLLKAVGTAVDGTATAADIFFNESASAATSDAAGVLTITSGTYELVGIFLGDD